jgi:hypothetical protein
MVDTENQAFWNKRNYGARLIRELLPLHRMQAINEKYNIGQPKRVGFRERAAVLRPYDKYNVIYAVSAKLSTRYFPSSDSHSIHGR